MLRRIALRRLELGAGVAAAVIGLLTLPMALLAPLFPFCPMGSSGQPRCPAAPHYVSLLMAHLDGGVWALLIALLLATLIGAAGAIVDARRQPEAGGRLVAGAGMLGLWGATLVVLAVCALGSRGPLGLLYLPSTIALALAAYVALLRRLAARRQSA